MANLETTRALRDVLLAKGNRVDYAEFSGGHDHLAWRATLPDALIALFGTAGSAAVSGELNAHSERRPGLEPTKIKLTGGTLPDTAKRRDFWLDSRASWHDLGVELALRPADGCAGPCVAARDWLARPCGGGSFHRSAQCATFATPGGAQPWLHTTSW